MLLGTFWGLCFQRSGPVQMRWQVLCTSPQCAHGMAYRRQHAVGERLGVLVSGHFGVQPLFLQMGMPSLVLAQRCETAQGIGAVVANPVFGWMV
jgi:hypothetical protein